MNSSLNRFLWITILLLIASNSRGAEAPAQFKVGTLSFTRPASWEWVEVTSSMRKAQLKVVDPKTKTAAEVVFFHFEEGKGGGTQANIDRWLGQFQEPREKIAPKVETTDVAGHKVTYVQAEGTYKSGLPGGPQTPMPDYALIGAIVEASGDSIFIRLTGPKALAKASVADFKKMVESGLKK